MNKRLRVPYCSSWNEERNAEGEMQMKKLKRREKVADEEGEGGKKRDFGKGEFIHSLLFIPSQFTP